MKKKGDVIIRKLNMKVFKIVSIQAKKIVIEDIKMGTKQNILEDELENGFDTIEKYRWKWHYSNRNEKELVKDSNGNDLILTIKGFENYQKKREGISMKKIFLYAPAFELGAFL